MFLTTQHWNEKQKNYKYLWGVIYNKLANDVSSQYEDFVWPELQKYLIKIIYILLIYLKRITIYYVTEYHTSAIAKI